MELDGYTSFDLFAQNRTQWSKLHPASAAHLATAFAPPITPPLLSSQQLKEWITGLRLAECRLLLIYGVDTGQAYLTLRDWLSSSPDHMLIFLESSAGVLNGFFSTPTANLLLADSQVWLYYIPTTETQIHTLEKLASIYPQYTPQLAQLPSAVVRPSTYWQTVDRCAKYFWYLHTTSFNEMHHCAAGFLQQLYRNLHLLPSSYSGADLQGTFPSIPAIICGAGPSLAKNRSLLKSLGDKALILAGGTAINALNAEGIHPHVCFGIDPNPTFYHRILTSTSWHVPFIYYYRMFHPALAHVHGDKILVDLKNSLPLPTWFHQQLQAHVPASIDGQLHNVVHLSTLAALAFGCNPLIFVGLDLAYSEDASYAAGLTTAATHHIASDFRTKSDQEEIILRSDIYGNPVKTLWKWIVESFWYGGIAKQHPERSFINATEGGIGLSNIPNLPLTAAVQLHLSHSWDISGRMHTAIQRCQPCLNIKSSSAINTAFEQFNSSVQRCLKQLTAAQELLEKAALPLEDPWKKPQFPLQTEIDGEPAFDYLLKNFDAYHTTQAKQHFLRLEADSSRLTPTAIAATQRGIHLKRYQHFIRILNQQMVLLSCSKSSHLTHTPDNTSITAQYDDARDTAAVYSYDDSKVTLIDPSLDLALRDASPQQLIEQSSRDSDDGTFFTSYHNALGQLHGPSTGYSKAGKLLSTTWYFAGQKQGWTLYYWNDKQLYCQLPYRDNLLHGNAIYMYSDGRLRSQLSYTKGHLHGTVELYYPDGKLHRRAHYNHGQRHGREEVWQTDGTRVLDAHYIDDKPVGTALQWHYDGTLIRRTIYSQSSEIISEEAWNSAGEAVSPRFNHDESYLQKMQAQAQHLYQSLESVADSFSSVGKHLIGLPILYKEYQQDYATLKHHQAAVKQLLATLDIYQQPHTRDTGEPLWRTPSFMLTVEQQRDAFTEALQQYLNKLQIWIATLQTTESE